MTATITSALSILKRNYSGSRLEYLTYRKRPFWGALKKKTGFGGENKPIPIQYATTGGRSKDFATSRANRSGARYTRFLLTRAKDYEQFTIETEALMASRGDANAFASLITSEGDAALNTISESLSRGMFSNTGASVGQIASGQGTATLVLSRPDDVVNFQVGDVLTSAPTDGSSGGVASANTGVVGAINRDAGTITVSAGSWHADFDDGDFLFHAGDYGNGFAGLRAWLPAAAPSPGDSFFGVDRSVDAQRLAGVRHVATAADDETIDQALVNAGARVETAGGAPDIVVCNPMDVATLTREAMSKTELKKDIPMRGYGGAMKAKFAYSGLDIALPTGEAKIMSDKHCQRGVAYMLQMDTWCFHSLGKAPFLFSEDGLQYLREQDEDGITGRFQAYGNLACKAPGFNARVDISAVN